MEEAAFLPSVQRIVGGVEVEDDPRWRPLMRVEEQFDEQSLNRSRVRCNLMISRGLSAAMLDPVQRALARQRCTIRPFRLKLASEDRQNRVVAQCVVIAQVFVAERDADDAL